MPGFRALRGELQTHARVPHPITDHGGHEASDDGWRLLRGTTAPVHGAHGTSRAGRIPISQMFGL